MRIWRIILLLTAFLSAAVAMAQLRIVPRDRVMDINSPILAADSSAFLFETLRIRAGAMTVEDAPSEYTYRFRNVSDAPIKVVRVVSSCSCARVISGWDAVLPGEEGRIRIVYDPKGHPGRFVRRFYVYTEGNERPSAFLSLDVETTAGAEFSGKYPVQKGNIRLRRDTVYFNSGVRGVETLSFVNVSDREFVPECDELFLPSCLKFSGVPSKVETGCEGTFRIEYLPSEDDGRSDKKNILLKGLGISPRQSALTVIIER